MRLLWVVLLVLLCLLAFIVVRSWTRGPVTSGGAAGGAARARFPGAIIRRSREVSQSVDYSIFSVTPESLYSSLMPDHIPQVNRVLLEAARGAKSIVDATAHVGVDTVNFMKAFPDADVTAVELNPATYAHLKKNIAAAGKALGRRGSARALNANGVDVALATPSDLAYFDPPWGGHSFKEHAMLDLTLTDGRGRKWRMPEIARAVPARAVIIKVPPNYPLESLKAIGATLHPIYGRGGRTAYWLAVKTAPTLRAEGEGPSAPRAREARPTCPRSGNLNSGRKDQQDGYRYNV